MTLTRKKTSMNIPILHSQELREQFEPVESTEPAGLHGGADLAPSPEEPLRYSDSSVQHQELTRAEMPPVSAEPEEMLVADARGGLTPGQMVDQKVMALLGSNYPGLFSRGIGRQGNMRRSSGK